MVDHWLRLDELDNAIDSLEMATHFLDHIPTEMKWKWVVISIHNALDGFLTCLDKGSNSESVREGKNKGRLIGPGEALKRGKKGERLPDGSLIFNGQADSRLLITSTSEDGELKQLHDVFRGQFEHFVPKGWPIETSGMPALIGEVVNVIGRVAIESNAVTYTSDEQVSRVSKAIEKLAEALARS